MVVTIIVATKFFIEMIFMLLSFSFKKWLQSKIIYFTFFRGKYPTFLCLSNDVQKPFSDFEN
jgi:hypothetical protein